MNNNPSELSKPIQIFKHPSGRNFWSVSADSNAGTRDVEPYYSQEYVSALLQHIASQDDHINQQQDRIESLEKKNGDLGKALGAAEKRLVHIKDACDTWERKAISNFEECATMSQRIEELEKRLATPVRVPSPAMFDEDDSAETVISVTRARLRAQGFKVATDGATTVGDE
ncbi:hypothetical protein [Serratia grimesii]|uniref:hypothetical protein n=1 Tax=Serratia grimesii TaxID=82995 RepID=UPI00217C982B|nr:hypothetical protein [Serratia grimesii]CAI0754908.1 Uncharacterised protein [Serratia grimesii]